MRRTQALAVYAANAAPNTFVFEYDSGPCAKECIIATFEEFMARVTAQTTPRAWHEHIRRNKPCKLFLDCENKEADVMPDLDTYVSLIHAEVVKCLNITPAPPPPLVIQGSRAGVFSVHLIWDTVWCETTDPALAIAEHLNALNIMGIDVDKGVYPTKDSVPRTLRMPYCTKLSDLSAGYTIPVGYPTFTPESFHAHLLTFPVSTLPDRLVGLGDLTINTAKRGRFLEDQIMHFEGDIKTPLLDLLESVVPLFQRRGFGLVNGGGWRCYTQAYCPVARKWHKKNSVYFNRTANGAIICTCADVDCKNVQLRYPISDCEVPKWKIDWELIDVLIT